jgi:hypothetical protein
VFNKTLIALTAAIAFGSVSSAFAYEDPENKIGDRYPFLEQKYSYEGSRAVNARAVRPQYVGYQQYSNEAPENKISDRYPLLELAAAPTASSRVAGRYLTQRAAQTNVAMQYSNEAPENKIGDRYPFLEPTYAVRATPRATATAVRTRRASRG